jgi:thiamine pyrophosphate-dependent acetolactate synthase large subunit-like protein
MAKRQRNPRDPSVSRRKFLSGAAVAGAAVTAQGASPATSFAATAPDPIAPARVPSALRPSARVAAAEVGTPAELPRSNKPAGSDFMVDVIKSLDIEYLPCNPASSFRGLHESLINYGGNKKPEFLTCMHEESAVAMCHGYFKASGKPLMTLVHGTVGLQHATMAVYNAWCDRVPVIIMGGNDMDAAHRAPGVPTYHSAQDINAIVRDYTKWDDTPVSLEHFAQSFVRAYRIAMTPPYEPVALSLDGGLQEEPIHENGEKLYVPRYVASSPPQGDSGAVREAARLLANAERPVIVVDRAARTPNGIKLLVELAELLQAPVVDQGSRMNFPNTHHLHRPAAAIGQADVVIGMELSDYWSTVNAFIDNGENGGHGLQESRVKPGTKLISINSVELLTKSNYQDFQRFQPVDVGMPADAEATLPALIEAVRSALPNDRKAAIDKRGEAFRKAKTEGRERTRQLAAIGWDAQPISTARLTAELWPHIKDLDWSMVGSDRQMSNWASRLWPMEKHYHHLGGPGGFGVGYNLPAAVGAALANRAEGRFSVNLQTDGDMMFAPGVMWTAARHKIPMLTVMHNNRGYHQEVMHVQRMSNRRNRVASLGNDFGPIGTRIENPDIDYAKLAASMGWWSAGPITDPKDLAATFKRAVEVVKSGQPALVDVVTQPR